MSTQVRTIALADEVQLGLGQRLIWNVTDALTMMGRNLRHIPRTPELLVDVTIQPIIFVLLFRYVFGGAIAVEGTSYVNYLMAGIFVQTIVSRLISPRASSTGSARCRWPGPRS